MWMALYFDPDLGLSSLGDPHGWLPCAALRDPARLRTWRILPHAQHQHWVGRVIGVFTLTPYDYWRRAHAVHHGGSGNLDRRGMGGLDTLTVAEYLALPIGAAGAYRLYRNHSHVRRRTGVCFPGAEQAACRPLRAGGAPGLARWRRMRRSALFSPAIWLLRHRFVPALHLPVTLLAASIGIWLFYVQHQFEATTWDPDEQWDMHQAALHGSSPRSAHVLLVLPASASTTSTTWRADPWRLACHR